MGGKVRRLFYRLSQLVWDMRWNCRNKKNPPQNKVEGKNQLLKVVLWPPHRCFVMHMITFTYHIHQKETRKKEEKKLTSMPGVTCLMKDASFLVATGMSLPTCDGLYTAWARVCLAQMSLAFQGNPNRCSQGVLMETVYLFSNKRQWKDHYELLVYNVNFPKDYENNIET